MSDNNTLPSDFFEVLVDELSVSYRISDFTKVAPLTHTASETVFLYALDDIDYALEDEMILPPSETFEIIGKSEKYNMFLLSYDGKLYACDAEDLILT